MATVDLQSGSVQEHSISIPQILSAIARYQSQANSARGNPVVIPATGTDTHGSLYALVFPSLPRAVQAVKLDSAAQGSGWLSFQFSPRMGTAFGAPIKLLPRGTEVGVVFADGSVAWYAA